MPRGFTDGVSGRDWVEWHRAYDDPGSRQSWRLRTVRRRIGEALDALPPGPIRAASLCAGDGRDLLGALDGHPRAPDVTAVLVEQHPDLAARARERASGFAGVRVVTGDAAAVDTWRDVVPVDLLLLCGIFGNVADADIARTVAALPGLCRPAATVIWTRGRRAPDLVPTVAGWFAAAGFDVTSLDDSADGVACVGVSVQRGDARLFAFR
jgi:hypothetical protein